MICDRRCGPILIIPTLLAVAIGCGRDAYVGSAITGNGGGTASSGGSGGDAPSEIPMHDFTCTDANELVVLDSRFGPRTPAGDGIEIVLGPDDRVTEVRERRGGPIAERARVLVATGDLAGAASWLRSATRAWTGRSWRAPRST